VFDHAGPPGINAMIIALTDDLQELLRRKVANGHFPDEEAVVKEALRQFLTGGSPQGPPPTGHALGLEEERLPGPFLEAETGVPPANLLRPGQGIARTLLHAARREPDRAPGE
jgi:hypothetical protein